MTSSHDGLGSYGQLSQSETNNNNNNNNNMGASLLAPDPEDMAKPASAVPMIEVVAPATLMEGYRLDTQLGDQVVTVVIPPGGVEKGQTFSVPLNNNNSNNHAIILSNGVQKTNVPVGHWKDGMWDCCRYGACHASLCTSWWCHALAAGQVISRLQLNWRGQPTQSAAEKASAFPTLFTITMIYLGLKFVLGFILMSLMPDPDATDASGHKLEPPDTVAPFAMMNDLVNYGYFFFSVYVIYNLRHYVRSKYAIPETESCPTGCEDLACACCCPCLTTGQMMRHTTDYDTYRAEWFSSTGLPEHVPALIV